MWDDELPSCAHQRNCHGHLAPDKDERALSAAGQACTHSELAPGEGSGHQPASGRRASDTPSS